MDLLCEKVGTGVCGQASAYWAGPRLCPGSALPCQHPYRTGVLGVLVTTPQPPVRAQAGDRERHTFQISPEKLDPQVPARGCRATKPRSAIFVFCRGKKK